MPLTADSLRSGWATTPRTVDARLAVSALIEAVRRLVPRHRRRAAPPRRLLALAARSADSPRGRLRRGSAASGRRAGGA